MIIKELIVDSLDDTTFSSNPILLTIMKNRLILKQQLLSTIKKTAIKNKINPEYPLTDSIILKSESREIEEITKDLESLNPFPKPLEFTSSLLEGIWQLHYSNAREIRSLNKLPLGFELKRVYQLITLENSSFFNIAFVQHKSKFINGYVKVTATFCPKIEGKEILPKDTINVNFEKRFISIEKIAGINTPILDPIKEFNARNPEGRIPSLKITYIDNDLRIGRGGDGSLFILSKQNQLLS